MCVLSTKVGCATVREWYTKWMRKIWYLRHFNNRPEWCGFGQRDPQLLNAPHRQTTLRGCRRPSSLLYTTPKCASRCQISNAVRISVYSPDITCSFRRRNCCTLNSHHFGLSQKPVAAINYMCQKVSLNDCNLFLPIYSSPFQLVCSISPIFGVNSRRNEISMNTHCNHQFWLSVSEIASKDDILMHRNPIPQYPDLVHLGCYVVFRALWTLVQNVHKVRHWAISSHPLIQNT